MDGYKGDTVLDSGYFFCPYIPGMTNEQIAEVNEELVPRRGPAPLQNQIMKKVREEPMLRQMTRSRAS